MRIKIINHNRFIIIILILTVLSVNHACKSILPDEYDKDTFKISGFDQNACEILSQPLYDKDTSDNVLDSNFVSVKMNILENMVDSTTLADNTHNQIIFNNFSEFINDFSALIPQELLVITRDDEAPIGYGKLNIDNVNQGEFVFFVTWYFHEDDDYDGLTEDNFGAYVGIDIIKSDTSYVMEIAERPLESISGCTTPFYFSTGDSLVVPLVKGRNIYKLSEGNYIVRFTISAPAEIDAFKLLIMAVE